MNLNQITLPAQDMPKAVGFYRKMGFQQIVDAPHYARFQSIEGNATFSLHLSEQGTRNNAVIYFECEKLDEIVSQLKNKGFEFESEASDQEWLWREARLRDPSGNPICLYWAGKNRLNPPWRVNV